MGHSLPLLLPHSDWLTATPSSQTHIACTHTLSLSLWLRSGRVNSGETLLYVFGRAGRHGQGVWRMGPCELSRSSRPGLAHFYSGSALMRKQLRVEVGEDRPLFTRSQTSSDARLWWGLEGMGDGRRFPTHFSPEARARWCRVAQGPGCPP